MSLIVVNARFLTQQITGVQRFALEISKQLKQQNPDIIFVCPKNIIHLETAKFLEVKVVGKLEGHFWEQLELPVYLKKLSAKPILINLANTAPLFFSNKVVTIHDLAFFHNPKWFSKTFYYFYKFLIPKIAKKSLLVFTVSEFSKNELIKYFRLPDDKIQVIYNASSQLSFGNTEARYQGSKGFKYILAVSSIEPRKNLNVLINAFRTLGKENMKLVLVGKNNEKVFAIENEKFSTSLTNDNIIFTGYVSDEKLKDLYAQAEVFVYPSLYEGFGLPPLEAMSYQCPVIVSDVGSLPEICGDAALYFDPCNLDDLAEKLNRVLDNDEIRINLSMKGTERVKFFSWESSASKINLAVKALFKNNRKSVTSPE